MTPIQWLTQLSTQNAKKPTWVGVSLLFNVLQGKKIALTGHASEMDKLFKRKDLAPLLIGKNSDGEKFSPMGAFEIEGHVFIAVVNPQDGYRSSLDQMLYVPGATLQTRLPKVPVHLELGESMRWDRPKDNSAKNPQFLSFVSSHTHKPVLSFGTESFDSYYPCGTFSCDMRELQNAIPAASQAELSRATRAASKSAPAKPKSKM